LGTALDADAGLQVHQHLQATVCPCILLCLGTSAKRMRIAVLLQVMSDTKTCARLCSAAWSQHSRGLPLPQAWVAPTDFQDGEYLGWDEVSDALSDVLSVASGRCALSAWCLGPHNAFQAFKAFLGAVFGAGTLQMHHGRHENSALPALLLLRWFASAPAQHRFADAGCCVNCMCFNVLQ
jgi:hypothetical protein